MELLYVGIFMLYTLLKADFTSLCLSLGSETGTLGFLPGRRREGDRRMSRKARPPPAHPVHYPLKAYLMYEILAWSPSRIASRDGDKNLNRSTIMKV